MHDLRALPSLVHLSEIASIPRQATQALLRLKLHPLSGDSGTNPRLHRRPPGDRIWARAIDDDRGALISAPRHVKIP
jgi:hypothetical protein